MSNTRQFVPPNTSRRWRDKFREAARGVYYGIRGQTSFVVHFCSVVVVCTTALLLRCNLFEWCVLLGCIAMVLVAELFNSAIEALFHGLDVATKQRWNPCLEIAAGAVLLAAGFAALIGVLIFGGRWWSMYGPP